ncbi:MAG TPA: hypothetical protein VGE52_21755 [Pirellulales bacterium]
MGTLGLNTVLTGMDLKHDACAVPSSPDPSVAVPPPLEYRLEEDDWLRVDPVYRAKLERFRLMFWSGASVLVALALVFEYSPAVHTLLNRLLTPVLVLGGLGLLFLFTVVARIARRARRESLAAAAQRKVLGDWKVSVDESGVAFTSPTGTRRLRWAELTEVHDLNIVVAFFTLSPIESDENPAWSPRDRFVGAIPRGAFASAAERAAFIDYTQDRLTAAQVPIRSYE